jgi:hypothetical protein
MPLHKCNLVIGMSHDISMGYIADGSNGLNPASGLMCVLACVKVASSRVAASVGQRH